MVSTVLTKNSTYEHRGKRNIGGTGDGVGHCLECVWRRGFSRSLGESMLTW